AWDYYPGAPNGGVQTERNLTTPGWLPKDSPRLAGNTAHVYNDANDDNTAEPSEEITPSGKRAFDFPFQNFNPIDPRCSAQFQCSWDPKTPNSWQTNRNQSGVQVFYYLGKYHDHLLREPIGFTRTAGNFDAVDGDAVQADLEDGSITANGLPDANQGFQPDTPDPGDVRIGNYVGAGQDLIRTEPMDCPVGTTSPKCPGTPGAGPGGYTYGDFGHIIGIPEVHADGEIWGETLWD